MEMFKIGLAKEKKPSSTTGQRHKTAKLLKYESLPKVTGQERGASFREAVKRPKVTLEELQRCTMQLGESPDRRTIGCGLYWRGAKRKSVLKENQ